MLARATLLRTVLVPLTLLGLGLTAQAGWGLSIGVASGSGYPRPFGSRPIFIGGGFHRPFYGPAPVYVMPRPVYVVPRPVYVVSPPPPPVYVQPTPAYSTYPAPAPSVVEQAPQPQRLVPIPQPSPYNPNP